MYFLIEFLQQQESLAYHQIWTLILLFLFALILSAAAAVLKNQSGAWDSMLVVQSLFLWGLVFDRLLITLRYEFLIYKEYEQYYSVWTPFRHLSLFGVELPLYLVMILILNEPLRKGVKWLLGDWLNA